MYSPHSMALCATKCGTTARSYSMALVGAELDHCSLLYEVEPLLASIGPMEVGGAHGRGSGG